MRRIWTVIGIAACLPLGAEPARYEVSTASVTLALDAMGRAVSMWDRKAGREMLADGGSPPLFALEGTRAGAGREERFTLTGADAVEVSVARRAGAGGLTVRYANLGRRGIDAVCTIRAAKGEPMLRWKISVRLPERLRLEAARFPVLALRARRDSPDTWVSGATKGGVYPRPSAWEPGRSMAVSQPGSMAAGFGCYYDATGGLYTAAYDARGYPKSLIAARTAGGIEVQWHHECYATSAWEPGYEIVTDPFAGPGGRPADWRDAADLYKRWAVRQTWCARPLARRSDLPRWLRQGPAMVRFDRSWLADPAAIERWLASYWHPHFGGAPLITAYWGWEKVATWVTPDYFPVFPSDEAFGRLARRARALGAHAFLWPSGYHYTLTYGLRPDGTFRWDDRARFDATARPHAVAGREGRVLTGPRFWLEGGQSATLCPGDAWTTAWFDRIAAGCAQRGAEMVQVDQVVGGSFPACYIASHGHPPGPGVWMAEVFRRQLRSMLAACRKAMPGAVVGFEEPNEHFLQEIGIQDYRDWEVTGQGDTEPASVFNYLYHEYVPTFQSNPRAGDLRQAAWCLVNGQIPHLVPSRQVGPGPALANGEFEEGTGAIPDGWEKVSGYRGEEWTGSAARDREQRHGGAASLRLENTEPGQTVQVSQNVPVGGGFRTGRTYRLGVWMKSEGVTPGNILMLGTFAEGLKVTWSGGIPVPDQPGGWTRGEATFTVPAGSQLLRIMLHLTGPGILWVDDLTLSEVRPDGAVLEAARPALPEDHAFMKRWVSLFNGPGRPYLLLGRMLHPPALQARVVVAGGRRWPAILCNAYEAPDGSRAAVLANATGEPQTGQMTWEGRRRAMVLRPWEVRLMVTKKKASSYMRMR